MPEKVKFHVTHASGQDENYKASELNTHSPLTRGWQSSRFCLYPQDIVIQLEERCKIKKVQLLSHQFLIATRVEFFVGDVPSDLPVNLQNARYTRLGYVALSDNDQTDYRARELKSVHVDAVGTYLKLVIHKNHVNKHNLYNQVGVVAINVIGDDIDKPSNKEDIAPPSNSQKPDYISPLDDLAFDMYQDPEVAQIIRKLEKKKQDAVLRERYDYAKKLKQAIIDLQKIGERLGKYEVEKRQAVEHEDYDKAKLKKIQMEEYRLQSYKELDLQELLDIDSPRHEKISPRRETPPSRLKELQNPPQPPPDGNSMKQTQSPLPGLHNSDARIDDQDEPTSKPKKKVRIADHYDDRPLPSRSVSIQPPVQAVDSPRTPRNDNDERALPAAKQSYFEDEDDGEEPTEPDTSEGKASEDSHMTEKDMREAGFVIDILGLPIVQKAYARSFALKDECMSDLVTILSEFDGDKEEAKNTIKAATFLIQRLLRDSVHAVFMATISALKYLLTVFVPKHKIPKSDIHHTVEKTLPELLHKSGDTAARIRSEAKSFILEMAHFPELKAAHLVPTYCVRPFKISLAPRLAQSHCEIVDELYNQLQLGDSGLTVDNLMKFCVNTLGHASGLVRAVAENLIIKLYKTHGSKVKEYLPPDDDKTRRNTLYRQLFEAFDKVDGKPSRHELEKKRQADEQAKKAEVEALQQQIAQMKAMQAATQNKKGGKVPGKPSKSKNSLPAPNIEDDTISSITKFDRTCIFCNEVNDEFTEEGLDLHYWKSCPMLKRCLNCKQVVEIAGLTEHLLTECDAKGNYSKCPRCSEAILKTEFDEHVKAKSCNPSDPKKSHCPLCHLNIPTGDQSWTEHLMTSKDGCKQNPRRVTALNKNKGKQPASRAPAKRGKIAQRQ